MSIYTISMEHLAERHSDNVSAFDRHGEYNAKCPNCGAMIHANHHDILNELIGDDYTYCPHCRGKWLDPEPYEINDYLSDNAPAIDYIVSPCNEYAGALIHHTDPEGSVPHVWTDTRARRTYCEYRGEVVSIPTSCSAFDDYILECFAAGPDW
jgi:Zn-finger nucleic acid-binding protein